MDMIFFPSILANAAADVDEYFKIDHYDSGSKCQRCMQYLISLVIATYLSSEKIRSELSVTIDLRDTIR